MATKTIQTIMPTATETAAITDEKANTATGIATQTMIKQVEKE